MHATYGPQCSPTFGTISLCASLANKLQAPWATDGPRVLYPIWRKLVIQSGLRCYQDTARILSTDAFHVNPRFYLWLMGYPANMGILHGAGNAIIPQVAARFISAFMDCLIESKV